MCFSYKLTFQFKRKEKIMVENFEIGVGVSIVRIYLARKKLVLI